VPGICTRTRGSIAVTEWAICTLKYECLRQVLLIRGLEYLEQLLVGLRLLPQRIEAAHHHPGRGPRADSCGHQWSVTPTAKNVPVHIERRFFPKSASQASVSGPIGAHCLPSVPASHSIPGYTRTLTHAISPLLCRHPGLTLARSGIIA